jgi:hypothetical protein
MELAAGIISSVIGSFVVFLLGVSFRKTLWKQIRLWYLKITNAEVSFTLLYVRNYPIHWDTDISNELFNRIREQFEGVERLARLTWNEGVLTIQAEDINTQLNLWLEEEIEVNGRSYDQPKTLGYKAYVETGNPTPFGLRQPDRIERLYLLSQGIHDVVRAHCFGNEEANREFLVCKLKVPNELVKFEKTTNHTYSRSRATFIDGTLSITCGEPKYIMQAMRAHVKI